MTNQINDGGPAFPAQDWQAKGNHHPGMTLRDYFAAAALQGFCSAWGYDTKSAKYAYDMADAMLKERDVKP